MATLCCSNMLQVFLKKLHTFLPEFCICCVQIVLCNILLPTFAASKLRQKLFRVTWIKKTEVQNRLV